MLHKSKSKKRNLFKYALVLPFLAIFLMSFNTEEVYVAIEEPIENLYINETLETKTNETISNLNLIEKENLEIKSKNNKTSIKKSILKISGTVTNTEGLGLPGVNILIDGKSSGAVTDFDGNYRIEVEKGDVLIFSYKGMVTQKIKATKKKINVVLAPNETQVTNHSNNNKIHYVDGNEIPEKEFKKIFAPNFEKIIVLNPKDAIKKYGTKGKNGAVEAFTKKNSGLLKVVQGNTAKNGEKPLIHLDGEEVSENVLNSIDANKVQYVNVIKGTKAVTKYGDKAKNGFVEIVTKKNIEKTFTTDTLTSTSPWKVTVGMNAADDDYLKTLGHIRIGHSSSNTVNFSTSLTTDSSILKSNNLFLINGKDSFKDSFSHKSYPIILVDDTVVSQKELQALNKNNIASVTILKDSDATNLYGKKAKEGVVIITTKDSDKWKTELKIGYPINSDKTKANKALLIIDGKEQEGVNIEDLDADKIESITVLKDKKASNKYGNKGKNGAIEVKSKTFTIEMNNGNKVSEAHIDEKTGLTTLSGNAVLNFKKDDIGLVLIDGKKASLKKAEKMSPDNIESIKVLKGKSAIEKYGKKGKNGVLEIITKKKN